MIKKKISFFVFILTYSISVSAGQSYMSTDIESFASLQQIMTENQSTKAHEPTFGKATSCAMACHMSPH